MKTYFSFRQWLEDGMQAPPGVPQMADKNTVAAQQQVVAAAQAAQKQKKPIIPAAQQQAIAAVQKDPNLLKKLGEILPDQKQ